MKKLLASFTFMALAASVANADNGTWNVNDSGLWSDTGNWFDGIIADDATSTANFTNDITEDRTVSLDSARTLNKLVFGDANTATPGSWLINNNSTPANTLSLGGTTFGGNPPTITVNALGTNKVAEISAVIAHTTELLNKTGTGTLVLSGANTSNKGMVVTGGVVIMNNANSNFGLNNNTATRIWGSSFEVNGTSAFHQSAGTITVTGANDSTKATGGTNAMIIGNTTYGAYTLSGGTLQVNDPWRLSPRRSQFTQTGGTFNVDYTGTGGLFVDRRFFIGNANDRGVIYATAGSTNITTASTLTGAALVISYTNTAAFANGAELTLAGTAAWTLSGGAGGVEMTQDNTATGLLNLNGNSALTTNFIANTGTGIGRLSFDGGTLKAQIDTPTFLQGLTSARIYSGGATIDTNGKNITIAQALEAPTGDGLTSIAITTAGSGYVGAPIVKITGGGGTGATAVADFDAATGTVTGITITSAGSGYTSNPTVTLSHGFQTGGTAATLGTVSIGALTGGGLTKSGTGTLTLSGNNTYTGTTTISGGTLLLASTGSIANSSAINVASGATFDVAAVSGGFILGNSQTLAGNGTVSGNATINGNLQPGNSPGLLSFDSNLTLASTANTTIEINGSATRGTDFDGINVTSALTYDGTLSLAVGTTFGAGTYSFSLFDFGSPASGSFDVIALSGNYTGNLTGPGDIWSLTSGDNTWTFTHSTGDLGLTVIPEPSTWALLAFSLTAVMALRRRRD
jgi:autotransporter-associated beta strand protein